MQPIIAPVAKELLAQELNDDTFIRVTNKGRNHIHIIDARRAPHTLREIGRLREESFRLAGGGSGLSCDLDEFDMTDDGYLQLVVWNPEAAEIVGGYRFIDGRHVRVDASGQPRLATAKLLRFSSEFVRDYLPYTIELGRSFVQVRYQPSANNRKGLFSLDNLWDGLGAIVVDYPEVRYFFGKVTMYPQFDVAARDAIIYFMNRYFPDSTRLVTARQPVAYRIDEGELEKSFLPFPDYESALPELNRLVRDRGENIPPLINAYMSLSPTMKTFGTARHAAFGGVEETGIMVTIADIYEAKKARHIDTYMSDAKQIVDASRRRLEVA